MININTKKLNQYLKSESNSPEMKGFVTTCVNDIITNNTQNAVTPQQVIFLKDLNLLTVEEKINS